MKKIVILLLFGFTFYHSLFAQSLEERINGLCKYYNLSITDTSIYYKISFFDFFPTNFQEFNSIYGYNDTNSRPLYFEAIDHISLFCNLYGTIPPKTYYRKCINIAIGGHWEADAINYFKTCLIGHLLSEVDSVFLNPQSNHDTETFLSVLEEYDDKDIISFWHFYFDEPIVMEFNNIYYKKTCDAISSHPRLYDIMVKEYKKTLRKHNRLNSTK